MTDQRWFKTVRQDLSSWHDPEYVYRVGGRHRAVGNNIDLCGDGLLHASPTPEQAAKYAGGWPFRLLEVTGVPKVVDDDKAGFRQLTVVRELDVALCFGPNGAAVVDVLSKVETWGQVTDPTRWTAAKAASAAARDAAEATAAAKAVRNVARHAARYAARYVAWNVAAWAAEGAAGYAASYAATAAVVADLVGQHGLTQQHLDALTAPFEAFHNTLTGT